jgi:hypothetical protein
MSKFAIKDISEIVGRQGFSQLVIFPDNADISKLHIEDEEGIWDIYENSLEERYRGSLRGLVALMNRKANLQPLNEKQFRDITPQRETVKEYEFKYQDLRAYGIKIPNEVLILVGGYKNQQPDDLRTFRSFKKQYLESLNK